MFKNAAKLSVTRSVGIKLSENMDWRPYAKKDRERKPRETKSVQMEDQRSHKGKDWQNFVGDCNGSEVFIERNQSKVFRQLVNLSSDKQIARLKLRGVRKEGQASEPFARGYAHFLRSTCLPLPWFVIGVESKEIRDGFRESARHPFKSPERRCISSALDQTEKID